MKNRIYNIVLKEKPLDEGLCRKEINDLLNMLPGVEVIPLEIQGENSAAMGFINLTDAELMNYDMRNLETFIKDILNDMNKENDFCEYEIKNNYWVSSIFLSR